MFIKHIERFIIVNNIQNTNEKNRQILFTFLCIYLFLQFP